MFSKKCISLLIAFIISFVAIPMITKAADQLPDVVDNTITLTEDVTINSEYVIDNNADLTLDLNGYSFTNAQEVRIDAGSKLTIVDNSEAKTGAVNSLIANNGILVLNIDNFTNKIVEDYTVNPNIQTILNSSNKELVKNIEKISYVVEYKDADYANLDLALSNANLINRAIYTDASLETLDNAVVVANTISRDLKKDNQAMIDTAASDINNAIAALEKKPADYNELDNHKLQAESINRAIYTDETLNILDSAVTLANAINRNLKIDEQSQVNTVSNTLLNALNGLEKKPASYTELDASVEVANNINKDIYTDESLEPFNTALEAATLVNRELKIDEQNQVDEATTALNAAINGLEKKPAVYTELDNAVDVAQAIDRDIYTDETLAVLDAALAENASLSRDLKIDEQNQIDAVAQNITAAVNGLEKKPAIYTDLDETIANADAINKDIYTDASLEVFNTAVELAKSINRELKIDEQTQVDAVNSALTAAINSLVKKPANYVELDNEVNVAVAIDRAIYTDETLAVLDAALAENASLSRDLKIDEQDQIDAVVQNIAAAIDGLEKKPAVYTDLDAAIAIAEGINKDIYTDESLEAFNIALEEAGLVNRELKIDEQETVDTIVNALNAAIAALEKKPAIYTNLDQVLETINNLDRDIYTDASLDILDGVMEEANALDRNLKIDEQNQIDNIVSALENAIESLEKKPGIYDGLDEVIERANNINRAIYTDESLNALDEALEQANAVDRTLKIDEQGQIDNAKNALENAITALEKKPANYDALDEELSKLADVNRDIYTDESLQRLDDAISAANNLSRDLKIDEQSDIDTVTNLIHAAIEALDMKNANYTELDQLIATAKSLTDDIYTSESINSLEPSVSKAESVSRDLKIDEQDVVDAAVAELRAVINALEKRPANYSELDQAVSSVDSINKEIYTDESISALEAAVSKAEGMSRDLKIDEQDKIDSAIAEINAAVAALEKKPADYSELEELLETVANIDRTQYTESSLELLDDLVAEANLLGDNLKIDEQAIINEIKEKINNAVESLKPIGTTIVETNPVADEEDGISIETEVNDEINQMLSDSMSDELKETVNNQIANGEDVTISIVTEIIDEETVNDVVKAEIEAIRNALPANTTTVKFFDLSVIVKSGTISEKITETTEDIVFSITIPEELLNENRTFSIYRIHNGVVSRVDTTLNGNVLTFATHEFSTYALVYNDSTTTTTTVKVKKPQVNVEVASEAQKTSNPNTGDNILMYINLLIIAVTGLVGSKFAYAKLSNN